MEDFSLSATRIELFANQNGQPVDCGIATGFFYRANDALFLITNWHVVTGIDPKTMMPVQKNGQVGQVPLLPEVLTFSVKQPVDSNNKPISGAVPPYNVMNFPRQLNLYHQGKAVWYEHSTRQNVDVVALRLPLDGFEDLANVAVNKVKQEPKLVERAGMDCFVLGYPLGMSAPGRTPIWKRGSVASEPSLGYRGTPAFLVDTATRDGMSGSSVIVRFSGILKLTPGPLTGEETIGEVMKFAGIYSGRIGDDEMGVQLGVVWRREVLEDILSLKTPGANPLR